MALQFFGFMLTFKKRMTSSLGAPAPRMGKEEGTVDARKNWEKGDRNSNLKNDQP